MRIPCASPRALVAALLTALAAGRAHAACNLIPGTTKTFTATLGPTNRPFAAPGESLELALRPCDTASLSTDPTGHVVTVLFTPPDGTPNVAIVATDCAALEAARQVCEGELEGGRATCLQVDPATDPLALALVPRDVCDAKGVCTSVPH